MLVLFAIPLALFVICMASLAVAIFLFARAHGNIKAMPPGTKWLFVTTALMPLLIVVLGVGYLNVHAGHARKELARDVQSGTLAVHRVDETATARSQTMVVRDKAGTPYLSFDLFADHLYGDVKGADINIRTQQFAGLAQIKQDAVGFIRFLRRGNVSADAEGWEERLKKKGVRYTRSQSALGTVFEMEEKDTYPGSGRFFYKIYFANSDYQMLISVSFNTEEDLRVRYSPVVSRVFAYKLYRLMTSTVRVDPSKLHGVYNLEAL